MKMTSEELAWKIRRHGVEMTHLSGGSHIGAILSVADIVAVLYTDVLKYDSKNPKWDERDRFILSKGHAGASIYAALAECDFFDVEELKTHYQNGSRLSGHVANHFRLNNLVAIVDHNRMQSLDYNENTLEIENFASKWQSFGWNVIEIDGNDHFQLKDAFKQTENSQKPSVIIANTIKGKGISFMEMDILWHYRFPHEGWEYDTAVTELHAQKPEGVIDVYTPNGIKNPNLNTELDGKDHTMTETWSPNFLENPRRVNNLQDVANIKEGK